MVVEIDSDLQLSTANSNMSLYLYIVNQLVFKCIWLTNLLYNLEELDSCLTLY